MAVTSWIRLCFASYLSLYGLATALVVPYHEQQFLHAPFTREHSSLEPAPHSVAGDCPRNNPDVKNGTLIDQLWRANCDLVNKFLNNTFSVFQAISSDAVAFDSFQYYSVQDYYYLVQTAQHKAFLLPTIAPADSDLAAQINETTESMKRDLGYASDFREDLRNSFNVSDADIDSHTLEAAGLGYVKWLQENTNLGWFAFQVSRIPCIYGWAELAYSLDHLPTVNTNTMFYEKWIKENSGWSYGKDMSERFEASLELFNNSETYPLYNRLFRQALRFETAFFESAMGKSLKDTA
ncbi:hypothetical protein F5X96DRAFT_687402 [Biscogniauxia mediterranea]|nr:hypothetical protein F5X96DRAFT_687402 [Biscogniauxia mediterranea]